MLDLSLFLCNINITGTFLTSHSVIVLLNNSMGARDKNSIHSLQIFSQEYFPAWMKAALCSEECEVSLTFREAEACTRSFVPLEQATAPGPPYCRCISDDWSGVFISWKIHWNNTKKMENGAGYHHLLNVLFNLLCEHYPVAAVYGFHGCLQEIQVF